MEKVLGTAAVMLALSLAGCGGNDEAATAPLTTPASAPSTVLPAAPPNATPTATPKPTTLTRDQAGRKYLALVKPANEVFDAPKCKASEDYLLNGGSWPPDGHSDWRRAELLMQACYKTYLPLLTASIVRLQNTRWPVDAKEDIDDLISLSQANLHCARQGTRAKTYEAWQRVFDCSPDDDDSADRVRARFGLPRRSS